MNDSIYLIELILLHENRSAIEMPHLSQTYWNCGCDTVVREVVTTSIGI